MSIIKSKCVDAKTNVLKHQQYFSKENCDVEKQFENATVHYQEGKSSLPPAHGQESGC